MGYINFCLYYKSQDIIIYKFEIRISLQKKRNINILLRHEYDFLICYNQG